MADSSIVPCLWFDDQAEPAADFYVRTFPRGRVIATSHYPEKQDNPSGKPRGSVLTVEFELAGQRFTALNGGPMFVPNPSVSFFVNVDTAAEADRLFATLAEGGAPLMAMDRYPWSERYGWVQDRFGVSWQVMAGARPRDAAMIVPALMFTGAQQGLAAEAMRTYASIFPDGHVEVAERYAKGEGPEGSVKHGRVRLGAQELVAMDSHLDHGFGFNEALSLQVMCKDQREVDRYWDALGEGGEPGPCGWLKDRFGVSWQVVPSAVSRWFTTKDAAARDRAFEAVMHMQKLDIAGIERAFAGDGGRTASPPA